MPLKHATETSLIFFLGLVILLTGFVEAFLPPITLSVLPWVIAFGLTILYPLALLPLFRSRRADYTFRVLHFFPVLMLLLWLGLELLRPLQPAAGRAEALFLWGWTLPAVVLGFVLLLTYCLEVIRQRRGRMLLLLLLLVPFAALAVSVQRNNWNPRLASILHSTDAFSALRRWSVAQQPSAEQQSSQRAWQEEQRRMQRRADRLAASVSSLTVEGARDAANHPILQKISPTKKTPRPAIARTEAPPKLPPSGFGTEVLIPLMLAGYTGVVHRRAKRRMLVAC